MKTTKFFQILSELSTADINRFEKFIDSPYFNINELLKKVFAAYVQLRKNKNLDSSKSAVWEGLFDNEPYDDLKFRKLNTDLTKLLIQFLVTEEFTSRPILNTQLLMEVANKKRIPKLINTAIRSAHQSADKYYNRNSDFYLYNFHIEKNLFYLNQSNIDGNTKKNIETIAGNLDKFYIAEKLKYYCEILSREGLSNISYDFHFIDELLIHIEKYKFYDDLIIRIYYLIYKTLSDPTTRENYYELKSILFANYRSFDGIELQELFAALLNYSSVQINLGQMEFLDEIIGIYDFIFEKNIWLSENHLTPTKFVNVITIALRAGNYDFAEIFIREYQGFLPDAQREAIVTFSLAQIFFYRKQFDQVITQLQQVDYPDLLTNLRAKTMYLATLLELEEYDAIATWTDSFKVFLNRKKKEIPISRIKTYQNFMTIVRMIASRDVHDSASYLKIEKELSKYSGNIVNEQWLQEKLAARKKV